MHWFCWRSISLGGTFIGRSTLQVVAADPDCALCRFPTSDGAVSDVRCAEGRTWVRQTRDTRCAQRTPDGTGARRAGTRAHPRAGRTEQTVVFRAGGRARLTFGCCWGRGKCLAANFWMGRNPFHKSEKRHRKSGNAPVGFQWSLPGLCECQHKWQPCGQGRGGAAF